MNEEKDSVAKLKVFRDRKEHRSEESYKHDRAVPYKRECLDWAKLLEEDSDDRE